MPPVRLVEFEQKTRLTAAQAAKLLALPRPTYYQYRRTHEMPANVERAVLIVLRLTSEQLDRLIADFVFKE